MEQEQKNEDKNRKLREVCEMFTDLPESIVKEVLASVDYDVEQALIPLFNELTKQQTKEAKIEEERRKKEETARKKEMDEKKRKESINYLLEIFQGIDINEIQEILERNEGDVEETVNELTGIIQQRDLIEKEKEAALIKEEQEQALKQLKIDALKEKFPELSLTEEVIPCLENVNWNIKDACKYLLTLTSNKMINQVKIIFKNMNEDEITQVLEKVDWKVEKAIEFITYQLKMKEQQERENREKLEREIKEQHEQELKEIELKKKQEQQKREIEEEEERKRRNRNKIEIEEEETRKIEENILEKSIRIEEEITKKREVNKNVVMNEFKMNLNTILTQQIRDNKGQMPGLVPPPTVKEINVKLGLIPPPIDDDVDTSMTTNQENNKLPAPVPDSLNNSNAVSVTNNSNSTITSSGFDIELQIKTDRVDIGQTIIVEYKVKEGNISNYDWIALYEVTQPNKNYITYQWTKQSKSGQIMFVAPSIYGKYECRYLISRSYEHVARSNTISVGPIVHLFASLENENKKIKVKYNKQSGNEYKSAWIGIYESNQINNKQYLHYEYANTNAGEVTFEAPIKPGSYELRYFTSSYLEISKSNPIVIEGNDKFEVKLEGELIKYKVNLVSVDPSKDGVWIGLFLDNETNNKEWRRYKYITLRNEEGTFNRPKHNGTYQARIFANKTYEPIWKSSSFVLA